jgi:hypothetical protein
VGEFRKLASFLLMSMPQNLFYANFRNEASRTSIILLNVYELSGELNGKYFPIKKSKASFQYTSLYPLLSHLLFYNITDATSFSSPFPPSPTSIEKFHSYKHILHLSLYMIMLLCVYVYLLD